MDKLRGPRTSRLLVCLTIAAAVVIFCWFRFRGFHLRPLDSPGSLHAILWPPFQALHNTFGADALGAWKWLSLGAIAVVIAAAAVEYFAPSMGRKWARFGHWAGRLFVWLAIGCLILCRYPILLGGASNVDEPEFLAAADKLLHDPVYFRAVDCNTSGPLNIYPLALPALAGVSPDYASSRLLALALIVLAIYALRRALLAGGAGSRASLAVVPAVLFFSTVTHPDFHHYASEYVSMAVTAWAVSSALRLATGSARPMREFFALGFLLSAAFFAKMQAVPIVAAISVAAVLADRPRSGLIRPALWLAAGFVPLQALNAAICAYFGLWRDFWIEYLVANWRYTRGGESPARALAALVSFAKSTAEMRVLIAAVLATAAASLLYPVIRGKRPLRIAAAVLGSGIVFVAAVRPASPAVGVVSGIAVLIGCAALLAIMLWLDWTRDRRLGAVGFVASAALAGTAAALYLPHNAFAHYLLLAVVPCCATVGWILMRSAAAAGSGRAIVPLVLIASCVAGIVLRADDMPVLFSAAQPALASPEGHYIDSLVPPGTGIVVWGWRPELYLSSGTFPATRDTQISRLVLYSNEVKTFYRDRFLRDMDAARPALVIDALDVSCCYVNDRKTQGFNIDPRIEAYIENHYRRVADAHQERYYLRRDLAGSPAAP